MGKRSSKKRQPKKKKATTRSEKYYASKNKASAKRKFRLKKRFKVLLILLLAALFVAAAVMLFEKFDPNRQDYAEKEKGKKEKIILPETERSSYFAGLLREQEFNVIARHPIDLDTALVSFLEKSRSSSVPKNASGKNQGNDAENSGQKSVSQLVSLKTDGSYDQNTPGVYDVKVRIKDRAGDKKTVKMKLGVKDLSDEKDNYAFLTGNGYMGRHHKGISSIDGIIIANKTFSVPKKYGRELTGEAFEAFEKMQSDAADDGVNIYIKSDYRPYKDQKFIYDSYVKKHGAAEADKYSARPGHSEHQIGECIDINYTDKSFADTPEGKWVNKNCSKYGYIIRYPDGKVNESMYIYEPWHLRYVGKKLAKKLYNGGDWITLEDHFGIDSNYNE